MLIIYNNVSDQLAIILCAAVTLLIVPLDILRHYNPRLNKFVVRLFRRVMRKDEANKVSGFSYLLVGALLLFLFFPRPVTTLSLFMLAFADPFASYVGVLWGKDKIIGNKSLQGSLAALAVCSIVAFVFYFSKI